nr:integrase, catalytic region, zinc finger, CCHC-type, peptidase aspartic, catalytic [Tanacetum cinerariifolium]
MQTQTSNTLHNAIMEAGSKDHPPMLAPSNYVQWKFRIKRYIDTKPNHELIHYCLTNPSYELGWKDKEVPTFEGSLITTTERVHETYKNVSQEIRDQLNAKAEAVQIILTGIDNDIYSTVDACPNACEMWKAIERLKQGESINVQDLETNLYWEFGKFTSQDGESLESYYSGFYKMMNELIRNQCKVTNHQVNVHLLLQLQPEWQRSQQAATRNRGKAIINSSRPIYDQEPTMAAEDDETSKDKEIGKLMALISLSENVGSSVMQKCGIQCYNCKEFRHVARECQKPKRAKDAAYHREKMLLCKSWNSSQELKTVSYHKLYDILKQHQNEVNEIRAERLARTANPLALVAQQQPVYHPQNHPTHYTQNSSTRSQQAATRNRSKAIVNSPLPIYDQEPTMDDTDDEPEDQELEAHYMYMAQIQEVNPDAADNSGPIFDSEPLQKIKFYKTREDKEIEKVIALENKVKVSDNIIYKTGQSVQTMNMLNRNCKMSFAKLEFLKKAQRVNPRLYDIGCYNDNLALMLALESDEVIRLEKESRSKLSDLIRPFDYEKLNNLYDLFVLQREKSSAQRYFSKRSKMSHSPVNNENSKEAFNKQATLLEKRMDESIPWDQKCKSSKEL